MSFDRRRSLLEVLEVLEDDELIGIDERAAASGGDVCEECNCTRSKHTEDGCACGKCDGFDDGLGVVETRAKKKLRRPSRAGRR